VRTELTCTVQVHARMCGRGTWPDADQEELKAALKHKKDDERAGKEKKQRKNKRIDAREAAFVKEVKRGDEPMRKLVTVRKRLTMSE